MKAFVIRPAMANIVQHGANEIAPGRTIEVNETGNSTHKEARTGGCRPHIRMYHCRYFRPPPRRAATPHALAYNEADRELGHTPIKEFQSMSTLEVSPADTLPGQPSHSVVNDFSIQVATVNGSGSQTANTVLMRSIFQMGIPVSGKNMFPSNIAGLAHLVHHSRQQARLHRAPKEIDFLMAMNPETAREDVMKLDSGAAVVYDEPLQAERAAQRPALLTPCLSTSWSAPVCPEAKLRKLVAQHDLRRRGGAVCSTSTWRRSARRW